MGESVMIREFDVSSYQDIIDTNECKSKEEIDSNSIKKNGGWVNFGEIDRRNPEASELMFGETIGGKDVFLKGNWDKIEILQGKVVSINEESVFLDCLLDQEQRIFQHRAFPIFLFKKFNKLTPNVPAIINTKMKDGAIRIDILPGDGIVNMDLFRQNGNWDSLEGKGLDEKLTEW
jgi:hypothetical protein